MTIKLRLVGISDAIASLNGLPERLQKRSIERLSQVAFDRAEDGARRHVVTGALLQSLFNRQVPKGRAVGHDPQRAPHAIFVQLGTRPHEIRPKSRKVLRWPTAGGKFAFAGTVKHPGYVGDAYLIRAATDAVREFAAIVDQSLKEQR